MYIRSRATFVKSTPWCHHKNARSKVVFVDEFDLVHPSGVSGSRQIFGRKRWTWTKYTDADKGKGFCQTDRHTGFGGRPLATFLTT